ncbi:hypothetical protein ACFSKW_29195 [Nonomuraea mangrovi]|uniref:Uncharacterized protein n=1 Tax=Nonomuraea mangrovi TaxID=2316207 RepID=A0ABW4T0R9_9ACTN
MRTRIAAKCPERLTQADRALLPGFPGSGDPEGIVDLHGAWTAQRFGQPGDLCSVIRVELDR